MASIAVVNVALMAWLWCFPMVPDPTGRDPNGVSTAPRSWTNVHRALGYAFVLIYVALLAEMVPRTWEFHEATLVSVVHGALGLLVGVLLVVKIAVIRRFRRFGHRLPWIGGALAATTLAVVGLGAAPAWRATQPLTPLPTAAEAGRELVASRCMQCHGASRFAWEDEDAEEWDEITREMQRNSRRIPGKEVITETERELIAAYLARYLGDNDDDREDDDDDFDH